MSIIEKIQQNKIQRGKSHKAGEHSISHVPPGYGSSGTIQAMMGDRASQQPAEASATPNLTGLPDHMKTNLETMSGFDMSDVRVHYNSPKPAGIGALAYTQGSQIYMGPGQDQHLGHEAWHVVQQKQGRVQANTQFKGIEGNDDQELEQEADVMGKKVVKTDKAINSSPKITQKELAGANQESIQRKTEARFKTGEFKYYDTVANRVKTETVGQEMEAYLDPNDPQKGHSTSSDELSFLFQELKNMWDPGTKHWVRGHLLNDHLGGKNVHYNLFPITGHANGDHLKHVESVVKKWITDKKDVIYKVKATQDSGYETPATGLYKKASVPKASGKFECTAYEAIAPQPLSSVWPLNLINRGYRETLRWTVKSKPALKNAASASAHKYSESEAQEFSYTSPTSWLAYNTGDHQKQSTNAGLNQWHNGKPLNKNQRDQEVKKSHTKGNRYKPY